MFQVTRTGGPSSLPRRSVARSLNCQRRQADPGTCPGVPETEQEQEPCDARTLDALLSIGGAIVAAVLLVAGGLLLWAGNFANNTVSQQLADQRITMPSGQAIADPQIKPYLEQYAGQPMTTGAQAQAYADHYILVHMNTASKGKTYGEVSAAYTALNKDANADPAAVKAAADLRQTMFMGDTLRGMLLNAYAFGTLGTIAIYAAIASFIGAAAMATLSLLGWRHLRRVPAEQEVRLGGHQPAPALG